MPMEVNGYVVMTVDDLIGKLQTLKRYRPWLGDEPVWLWNVPPLRLPVIDVKEPQCGEGRGVALFVAKD